MFKVWLISRVKPLATFTILDGLFPKQVIHTDIKLNLTRMPLILVMSNGAQPCKIYIFNLFFLIKNNGNLGRAAELKIFFKCWYTYQVKTPLASYFIRIRIEA